MNQMDEQLNNSKQSEEDSDSQSIGELNSCDNKPIMKNINEEKNDEQAIKVSNEKHENNQTTTRTIRQTSLKDFYSIFPKRKVLRVTNVKVFNCGKVKITKDAYKG